MVYITFMCRHKVIIFVWLCVLFIFPIITGITMLWHDTVVKTFSCVCRYNSYNFIQRGVTPRRHASSHETATLATESSGSPYWILFRRKSSASSVIETFEIFTYVSATLDCILLNAFTFMIYRHVHNSTKCFQPTMPFSHFTKSYYCSNIYIKRVLTRCVSFLNFFTWI